MSQEKRARSMEQLTSGSSKEQTSGSIHQGVDIREKIKGSRQGAWSRTLSCARLWRLWGGPEPWAAEKAEVRPPPDIQVWHQSGLCTLQSTAVW